MKTILLLLISFLFVSCGESPLLNHDVEKNFHVTDIALAGADELKFTQSGFSFNVDWQEAPRVGETKFKLKLWKTGAGTINGPYKDPSENLHVLLWMPSMGHGSAPVKITKTAPGEYEVTNVYFIMGGKWEVKFQLLSSGKVVDETVLTYNL